MRPPVNRPLVRRAQVRAALPRPRTVLVRLGAVVTLVLLYLSLRGLDLHAAWRAGRSAELLWLAPALAALAAAIALRAGRWRSLFAPPGRPGLGPTLSAYLVGLFFNGLLPLRAGEAARIVALARRTGRPAAEVTATVVVERLLDVVSLLALLLASAPWLPHLTWLRAAALVAAAAGAGVLAAVVLLLRFGDRPLELLLRPLALLPGIDPPRAREAARAAGRGLVVLRSPRAAVVASLLTLASWLALAVSCWTLTLAFHLHLPLLAGLLVVVATNLGQVLPSSPAALGVFEAATLVALSAYGVARAPALSYAVLLHVLNLVPFLAAGPLALRATPVAAAAPSPPVPARVRGPA